MDNISIDTALKISAALTGAILGWMAVLRPTWSCIKARRQKRRDAITATLKADEEYRQAVISKLDALDKRISVLDCSIAELQRDSIEHSYCMFALEHKYCPSGAKEAILNMFESYRARGYNHIARTRIDELLALPEFPTK